MKPILPDFWITNISNRNVSLSDLGLSIPARGSVNLMDTRHYYYSLEQLEVSLKSGSLYKKRDKIVKRAFPPVKNNAPVQIDTQAIFPSKSRSIFEIKEEKFEELEFTDDQYAAQIGDDEDNTKK